LPAKLMSKPISHPSRQDAAMSVRTPREITATSCHPYLQLVRYKRWADRGLYDLAAGSVDRLAAQDTAILVQLLDHIHVVDRIFQHHLEGRAHGFRAPRSEEVPDLRALARGVNELDDWYVSYVAGLSERDFAQPLDFAFTNGSPARMTRGEILLHVCLHGTYHRGNAGLVLYKNGIKPSDDRVTDFLETGS
jgi:uncharacterized damage-inducible protein DinB